VLRYAIFKFIDLILAYCLIYGFEQIVRDMILFMQPGWTYFFDGRSREISILYVSILFVVTVVLSLTKGIKLSGLRHNSK